MEFILPPSKQPKPRAETPSEASGLDASRWPATKIEMWSVEDLTPYINNARTHPPKQVDQIAASMKRYGFTMPMLVAEREKTALLQRHLDDVRRMLPAPETRPRRRWWPF